ncbi:MAG: tripartite tricarboxylate transporter substrate binding protein [Burkholderiales bacterium]
MNARIPGRLLALVLPLALAVAPFALHAQDFPSRPVRIVVPFSPGGAVDGPTRVIAQELAKRWNVGVVVDNKPGAGGTIGTEIVAKAPPDGYTLLLASQTNAISASIYKTLPYDPVEDFAPISLVGREPGVLVVHPSFPARTLKEFIGYVKENPGKVNYASSGNGSGQHLFMAKLASMTGMQLVHVPYKGSGQATADLLGGVVPVSIPGTAGMVAHIKSGRLRPIAVTGATRSPQLPDVPTIIEAGVPGYEAYVWMGLLAPKGTPQSVIDRIYRDLLEVLATAEVKSYMTNAGMEIVGSTPQQFARFFRDERDQWGRVVRETGAKAD